jgi:hypothetical protein
VALIRTDVSEDRIASIFRVDEFELVTERSSKLLYRHRLVGEPHGVISQKMKIIIFTAVETSNLTKSTPFSEDSTIILTEDFFIILSPST